MTPRQQQVFALLQRGTSDKSIARELVLSPATVKIHVRNVLRACAAHNRRALLAQTTGPLLVPERDADLLRCLSAGKTITGAAKALGISRIQVRYRLQCICKVNSLRNNLELIQLWKGQKDV